MNCPDCGKEMSEVAVSGFDKSFRCENCGGFFMESWVANRVAEGQMNHFAEVKLEIEKFSGRSGKCPADGSPLFGYNGEEIPPEITAFKCSHCGWWWFPDGNLHKFRKAYEAKNNYVKLWKKKTDAALIAMPILLVLTLIVGLGVSVVNIGRQQQNKVQATLGDKQFEAKYLGEGRIEARFRYDKQLDYVLVKKLGGEAWGPVPVIPEGEGWYRLTMTDLTADEVYQVQIGGSRYYFQTE